MDFVLDQYRKCWGWILSEGRTTLLEVFDTRWSHCHQWSACPTWQLSRYGLGLHPRFDWGADHFDLAVHSADELRRPGSVAAVRSIPFPAVVSVRLGGGEDRGQ